MSKNMKVAIMVLIVISISVGGLFLVLKSLRIIPTVNYTGNDLVLKCGGQDTLEVREKSTEQFSLVSDGISKTVEFYFNDKSFEGGVQVPVIESYRDFPYEVITDLDYREYYEPSNIFVDSGKVMNVNFDPRDFSQDDFEIAARCLKENKDEFNTKISGYAVGRGGRHLVLASYNKIPTKDEVYECNDTDALFLSYSGQWNIEAKGGEAWKSNTGNILSRLQSESDALNSARGYSTYRENKNFLVVENEDAGPNQVELIKNCQQFEGSQKIGDKYTVITEEEFEAGYKNLDDTDGFQVHKIDNLVGLDPQSGAPYKSFCGLKVYGEGILHVGDEKGLKIGDRTALTCTSEEEVVTRLDNSNRYSIVPSTRFNLVGETLDYSIRFTSNFIEPGLREDIYLVNSGDVYFELKTDLGLNQLREILYIEFE